MLSEIHTRKYRYNSTTFSAMHAVKMRTTRRSPAAAAAAEAAGQTKLTHSHARARTSNLRAAYVTHRV